ncbi:MAG: hypothetical protein IKJ09_00610 [Bacteroidaceae bacterium]|nr:hypothetical protein [Bacteroidaceae bacterium]
MSTTLDDIKKQKSAPSAEQLAKDRDRVSAQSYEEKNKEVATTVAPYAFHPDSNPNKEGGSANTIASSKAATASQPTDAALVGGTAPTTGQQTTANGQQPPKVNSVGSMMDYVNQQTKSMMPTEEQLKAEKKRYKRNAVLAAIGDGVAALANLGGTIYGAPHTEYAPALSSTMRERYEKLRKEREDKAKEIMAYRMRAFEGDRAQANADRNFAEGVRRFDIGQQNNTRDFNEGVRRYEEQRADNKEVREQQQQNWQQTFDANKEKTDKTLGIQETNAKAALKRAENYAEQQGAKRAAAARGKLLGFSDGNNNEVSIYENVWKGSMQQVYDAMIQDVLELNILGGEQPRGSVGRPLTAAQKEDWVKQHWTKSPRATAIMLALSQIDPATLVSQVQDGDEDYEQYAEDDYEQYAE